MGGDSYAERTDKADLIPGQIDRKWENGYKNDVWRTTGTDWSVRENRRVKSPYGRKIPEIRSQLAWEQATAGLHPAVGQTNDDWISCYRTDLNAKIANKDCSTYTQTDIQWSPRRHAAGVYFNGYMWVMGGRAREFVALAHKESIGGIIGPRVGEIPVEENPLQEYTTQRENIVLKSDVWRSADGISWELVSPGCKAPQSKLVPAENTHDGKYGREDQKCSTDSDCYGVEYCDTVRATCVCPMWSSREQHTLAAYGQYLYVVGGYTSKLYPQYSACGPYACGDTYASSYRSYMADVWRSSDGVTWEMVTDKAFTPPLSMANGGVSLGRGGHAMLALVNPEGVAQLWVFGGRGGSNTVDAKKSDEVYYNDIWVANVGDSVKPQHWRRLAVPGVTVSASDVNTTSTYEMPWAARTGLSVCLDDASSSNLYTRTLYLSGGYNNESVLDDVWSLRLDDAGEYWREDFTSNELYGYGVGDGFRYYNSSPSQYYVSPDSDITFLRRFWVPAKPRSVSGVPYELRSYLSDYDIASMREVGVNTIRDLATADVYTILKLRGFDIPQVPKSERYQVYSVCDIRAFAISMVDKCSLNPPLLYEGEPQMPWNIVPVFGGPPPLTQTPPAWHGRKSYKFLETVDDFDTLLKTWDGCTYVPKIQGLFGPNVDGLGFVDQVQTITDPSPMVENLVCRQDPGKRAFHTLTAFQGRVYLLGGKSSDSEFHADTWYRDGDFPVAEILKAPASRTSEHMFHFSANEPGVHYEYRVWDPINYVEVRPWNKVRSKTGVVWLNWRRNGPGSGFYQLYVRAVDPAGNSDARFSLSRNVYKWYYVSPIPWDIIGASTAAFLTVCFLAYLEYRRRVKKAAMERYAMKRMRRKFKAMQRDIDGKAVDWRTLYLESKQAEEAGLKIDRKKLKKVRDKNAEKREKEKKKREKEKELIKKKLKANKDFKEKKKVDKSASEKVSGKVKSKPDPGGLAAKKRVLAGVTEATNEDDEGGGVGDGADDDRDAREAKKNRAVGSTLGSSMAPGSTKLGAGDTLGGKKEIAAGELASSKNTEMGFKQRKVNKRYKNYEVTSGNDGEGKWDVPTAMTAVMVTALSGVCVVCVVQEARTARTSTRRRCSASACCIVYCIVL